MRRVRLTAGSKFESFHVCQLLTSYLASNRYFLITPKLLSGLDYHPKMKILTVYNGEWMPEVPVPGDMMALLQAYRGPAANTNQVQTPIGPAAH